MYQIFSGISLIIRMYLCYITIDNIPILANPLYNSILFEVISLYTILWAISYFTVGLFYDSGDDPILGVFLYFVVYVVFLGLMYLIMIFLTFIGILPIQI